MSGYYNVPRSFFQERLDKHRAQLESPNCSDVVGHQLRGKIAEIKDMLKALDGRNKPKPTYTE